MDIVFTSFFWVTLAQIMVINILLGGDNAVALSLASRSLPPVHRKHAMLFGNLGAITLRIVVALFIVVLLDLPLFKLAAALWLCWVGIKLLVPESPNPGADTGPGVGSKIKAIVVANVVISLDNVVAVAAAAQGNVVLLVLGVALSVPVILYGSTQILKLRIRYKVLSTIGAGLLGFIAGEMLIGDPAIRNWVETHIPWANGAAPLIGMAVVVIAGTLMEKRAAGDSVAANFASPVTTIVGGPSAPEVVHAAATPASAVTLQSAASVARHRPAVRSIAVVEPPLAPGYHHISRLWRTLPDGRRDYAAMHGLTAYRTVAPVSGRLRPPPQQGRRWGARRR